MTAGLGPLQIFASGVSAIAVATAVWMLVPPPRRLRDRVGPYLSPTLVKEAPRGPVRSVFGPIIADAADRLGRLLDRSGPEATLLRLRQAGWFRGLSEEEMLSSFRLVQFKTVAVAVVVAVGVGQAIAGTPLLRLLLVGLALVVGASRSKGRLERAVQDRRERMRIEIYTVNQLLAMRVRAGGGVIQAVSAIAGRGSGEVVAELEEALRLHRAGWRGADAFRRIAELTPEPFCSRTYRLLASAEERGADLAGALLSLSEDVRETRREATKRAATKRRAAMLVPTIAVLAPVLILFVAAPLPYLITSWQGGG